MNHLMSLSIAALIKADETSTAYQAGEAAGRIMFYVVVAIVVIWIARKVFSKK